MVVDLLMAAAEDARRRMAAEETIGHLRRGLEIVAADDPRRSRLSLDLGVQYHHRDRADEADAAFREAADVALALEEPGHWSGWRSRCGPTPAAGPRCARS